MSIPVSASHQQIHFCTAADGVRLAYATVGEGLPLVKAANWLTHVQYEWQSPVWRHWLQEFSRDHMLVRYDERGCGLSDWDVDDLSFDAWVRDLETVVDALGLERFPLLGISQGGPVCLAYAARHPERVSHLILYGSYSVGWAKRPESNTAAQWGALTTLIEHGWGRDNPAFRQVFTSLFIPDGTPEQHRWFDDLQRVTTSPEMAVRFEHEFSRIDVRDLLPQVQVPTLVLHARDDAVIPIGAGQRLAEAIPNARFVPLDGNNHVLLEHEPAWLHFLWEVRAFLGAETAPARTLDTAGWDRLSGLFEQAVALPADERQALVEGVGDAAVRAELEALLAADAQDGESLGAVIGGAFEASADALFGGPRVEAGQMVGPYRIEEKLGGGGMGVVYRAEDTRLGRTVALKFLPPHMSLHEEARKRFVHEARTASALDHPNICTIYNIGETTDGRSFIVMACYDGETLKTKAARGPLPIDEAVGYALQMAEGLARAHEVGIVHRDVKPANVIVTERGRVKLLDFGVAKMHDVDLTRTGVTIGTAAYMSPEQTRGVAVDHRADLWALGAVLYELLAGTRPFKGGTEQAVIHAVLNEEPTPLRALRPEVPDGLQHLVHQLLEKDPVVRPLHADAVIDALRHPQRGISATVSDAGETARETASIAVLPFADMSPSQDQGYFCEGLAEELINALTHIEGLHVASRTSSFAFNDTSADVREIGERLQVGTVLEGSVRKAGDRLRVTVQLIDTADGYHRWSERYDGSLEDVFAVQDEIAGNTVRALRGVLTEADREALQRAPAADVQAYEYYLQGRQFMHQNRRFAVDHARRLFHRAIDIDPAYAPAYAGLAYASYVAFQWYGQSEEDLAEAKRASQHAVELAPDLAEAHVARGLALTMSKQYAEAGQAMEQALRLNPNSYDVNYFFGRLCFMQGKYERAATFFERASELDPQEYQATCLLQMPYEELGRHEDALAQARTGFHRAERRLELYPDDVRAVNLGAGALLRLGETEHGLEWIQRALAMAPDDSGVVWNAACAYARADHYEEALDCLERAIGLGSVNRAWVDHDPDMNPLRDHPRFQALMESIT
ncbi:MAG: alpha/beta fold hydrolase [Rhodothermaceae bacterium]|nr:alpha/beta fold hydrolase [Rhodothermaceae bacterium]